MGHSINTLRYRVFALGGTGADNFSLSRKMHKAIAFYALLLKFNGMADMSHLLQQLHGEGLAYTDMLAVLKTEHNISISMRCGALEVTWVIVPCIQGSDYHMESLPRSIVCEELKSVDPEGAQLRRTSSLRRRQYHNEGPNYLIHIDGYDKLKRYGICIHGAIDGYSKKLLWLQAGHSNNHPQYVAWFFSQYIKEIGGVPRCVRMDRGTENTLIEDIQASFRSCHTDDMANRPVLYGSSNHNQPIERWWRNARQLAIQFYMDYFKELELRGLFEIRNQTDGACLRYCFLHIVQQKLLELRTEWNNHTRRASHGNPGGVPNALYDHPQLRGHVNYKSSIRVEDIDDVMTLCLPPKERGCNIQEKERFDNACTLINGSVMVPCCMEDAQQLYMAIRAAIRQP